jgi:hypothetical protein
MRVDVQESKQQNQDTDTIAKPAPPQRPPRPSLFARWRSVDWNNIQWRIVLATAVIMAVGWCALFAAQGWIQFLAGIVPVSAGLFLGGRVKKDILVHGLLLGIIGFTLGLLFVVVYGMLGNAGVVAMPTLALTPDAPPIISTPEQLITFYISFSLFAMIPFPALGTVIAHQNERRRRDLEAEVTTRGGSLDRPGVVRTLEDLQGLSLPQLGGYIRNLYVKYGFTYKDYRFLDKDKHLDIIFTYKEETYLMRLSVLDKVRSGTVETLVQDMRQQQISKGIVITSTEFTPDVHKSVRGRQNILLIDGQTLFDMAER